MLVDLPIQTLNNHAIVFRNRKKNSYDVSIDGVTVRASHFARRYGRRLSIAIYHCRETATVVQYLDAVKMAKFLIRRDR